MPMLMVVAVLVVMVSFRPMIVRHLDLLSVQVLLAIGAKRASWPWWLGPRVGMVGQPLPDTIRLSEQLLRY
jgi:hypothetical protein